MFKVLESVDAEKVEFATHKLGGEAENGWKGTRQLIKDEGIPFTWDSFKIALLVKYNPEDVRSKKEIELKSRPDEAWKGRHLGAALNSSRRGLVAADLVGENAEVVQESEGEESSAAAEEEVFGFEVSEGNLLLYSVQDFPQVLVLRC
ncbi:cellular nucleic acid-binding protein [Senna tora]|uniref:Cellular nucleic acid-binding protein n=1 Tax=Senna tora TaxID=362788 RepID=A0A834X721_9FABA|nr:cellular nucleic acid-binding protein [Senna tora]